MEDKIELIEEISGYHPASEAGKKRGWNTYTGGMADTGHWFRWKMLKEASVDDLKACLEELKEEWRPKPEPEMSEEDKFLQSQRVDLPNGGVTNKLYMKKMEQMHYDLMASIILGTK